MKLFFLSLVVVLFSHQLTAQIRCEDVKCITEEKLQFGENSSMEELAMIEDVANPVVTIVFDSMGYETEQITYQIVPFNGCIKSCDEKHLIEISYYENGKQQGPRMSYSSDGEVSSKGHYFNNHKIGEHVKYGKNREVTQRVNYDQFGKKHGEEWILRGDMIEVVMYEHGKSISTTSKKVKKK